LDWLKVACGAFSSQLSACLQRQLDALESASPGRLSSLPVNVRESLLLVFAASDFVAQACARDTELLPDLIERFGLIRRSAPGDYAARAPAASSGSEAQMLTALRRWRRREMVRIAWRALAGWSPVEETLADLSEFADTAIRVSVEHARQSLTARYGEPRSASGAAQPLVIVAMGKLGGRELNFSSDVDLVLLFPEHGETDGPRPIANEEFFTRLGQSLVRLLETATPDGFTLRVDMRLRPFGDSGPLVTSFASLEDYLPLHGRDWERYAYVKARPVTAQERYAEIRASALGPFVYRRYLDYGVFESLREMRALIEREVERRELADHIKLGPGGIREIEFIVQAFQLIRGGRERRLQTSSLLQALATLGEMQLMPREAVAELRAAYLYLRRLENCLQMLADRQTHQLPPDALSQERIALAMRASGWPALRSELRDHQARVSGHFHRFVFGASATHTGAGVRIDLGRLWDEGAESAVLAESLGRAGWVDPAGATRMLLALRASALVRKLDEPGRQRLQALLPPLLEDIGAARLAGAQEQQAVLHRIISILEATGKRSAYFALLRESQAARSRLIEICRHGEFLVRQIASYPLLLDELVDERGLSELPGREGLARELQLVMQEIPGDDPEHQVEALCHFQRAAVFRIGLADLTGRLPVMRVSDRLTEIAELIIARAMELAWGQITAQYGVPYCTDGAQRRPVSICAVGYGKLGGLELGYASDLDLVFLHDSRGERQETDGGRPIENALFFVRLTQRMMHLLTVHSAAGRLYEVDVRLRPSGKGGLLVTQIDAFADYQRREAWTWEHQALLHARAVAGPPQLRAEFERTRLEVLRCAVRRETLRDEVRAMRERMRRELSKGGDGRVDLKQDAGGIADIEFLAQYWALKWARDYPPVALFSDTIRQLESVASADLVPQQRVDTLTAAYRAYRTRLHHLSLAGEAAVISAKEFVAERDAVTAIWQDVMVRAERV